MTSRFEAENEFIEEMKETAKQMARPGFGILATDESVPTAGKRLKSVGLQNNVENRRSYRDILYTTEDLGQYVSGVIMYDETLYQTTTDGKRFVDVLHDEGICVGVKVDKGLIQLAGTNGETAT